MLYRFADGFIWEAATAAFRIEGAFDEGCHGPSYGDRCCRKHRERSSQHASPDIACNHYHRYRENVRPIKQLAPDDYRLSIALPRILPAGTDQLNQEGVDYYGRLSDALIGQGIHPRRHPTSSASLSADTVDWLCINHWFAYHASAAASETSFFTNTTGNRDEIVMFSTKGLFDFVTSPTGRYPDWIRTHPSCNAAAVRKHSSYRRQEVTEKKVLWQPCAAAALPTSMGRLVSDTKPRSAT